MVAIKKQLDLLGVIVLGVTTAVGGGMLRILLLEMSLLRCLDPIYVLLAFITVMLLFITVRMNQKFISGRHMETFEKVMNIFDAIGLGAFTVVGIDTAVWRAMVIIIFS